MFKNITMPAFVFKLKEKDKPQQKNEIQTEIQEKTACLTIDIFKYIVNFIYDMDTLISYFLAMPYSLYEVKKKLNINMYINYINEIPYNSYKFIYENAKNLEMLTLLFSGHMLLTYFANNKEICKELNIKQFIIFLIKKQNKLPRTEIYKLIKKKESKYDYYLTLKLDLNTKRGQCFNVIDTLTNEQIANISENIEISEIDNHILKELQFRYKNSNSNIKNLNRKERALLMYHYEKYNKEYCSVTRKNYKNELILIEAIKQNWFKIINVVFENNLLSNFYRQLNICNEFICNLDVNSVEFKTYQNIITYLLEKLIKIYSYENIICCMINFAYRNNNNEIVKYLLSLKNSSNGISILIRDTSSVFNYNCLKNTRINEVIKEYHREFTDDLNDCKLFVMYDYLIDNLPDGIDINLITIDMFEINKPLENNYLIQYFYIIENFIKYFDSPNCNNPNDKYYCTRSTLINMYYILLHNYIKYNNIYIKSLQVELDKFLQKKDSDQPSNEILREYIKNIYYYIRKHKNQCKNLSKRIEKIKILKKGTVEFIMEMDFFLEYLITIPIFLKDNIKFRDSVKQKMIEFKDPNVIDENIIEHAHFMATLKELNIIVNDMKD